MTDEQQMIAGASRRVVDAAQAAAEMAALRAAEKAHTRAGDALAAQRRRLPLVEVDGAILFQDETGTRTLVDLFEGRSQLLLYHHMLRPADEHPCPGCSMMGDQIPRLEHLWARDTTLAFAAAAPVAECRTYRARLGWRMPFYSETAEFRQMRGVGTGHAWDVFLRDGGRAFATYQTSARGCEMLGSVWGLLDISPLGRQEDWEDSPSGSPQTGPYLWWRLHDEYAADADM
ncbi:MAG: DUF899 family protein [Paracoccaceae bacterium]|nr:MAG: DUF899 family protein [Paracoccaceae bacterium]